MTLTLKIEDIKFSGWLAGSPRRRGNTLYFDYRTEPNGKKKSAPQTWAAHLLNKPREELKLIFKALVDDHNQRHKALSPPHGRHSKNKRPAKRRGPKKFKRGAYGPRKAAKQTGETPKEERVYLNREHLAAGVWIKSIWKSVRPGSSPIQWQIGYIISGCQKRFTAPRALTQWLDGASEDFVKMEIETYRDEHNSKTRGRLHYYPPEFQSIRKAFLIFSLKTARGSTVEGYIGQLGLHVFPYFYRVLRVSDVNLWPEHYGRWSEYLELHILNEASRNSVRTAFRRYLKYLIHKGLVKSSTALPSNVKVPRGTNTGKIIPGKLPEWTDVILWLKTLPLGNINSWYVVLLVSFGVRVSEVLAILPRSDLIGKKGVAISAKRNRTVATFERRRAEGRRTASAFLNVSKKDMIQKVAEEIDNLDPADNDSPKTGSYVAACFNKEMALLVKEHALAVDITAAKKIEASKRYANLLTFIKSYSASEAFPFHAYKPHDFRRLHITLTALWLDSLEETADCHGHKDVVVTRRYMQWGLLQLETKATAECDFEPLDSDFDVVIEADPKRYDKAQ